MKCCAWSDFTGLGIVRRAFRGTPTYLPSCLPSPRTGRRAKPRATSLRLARLQSLVHRFERELHRDRSIGKDLIQDRFGARDQVRCRNDFVDQADAIGLLRADHFSGENELQRAAFADQPRQTLRSAAARDDSDLHFRLAELRVSRQPFGWCKPSPFRSRRRGRSR